MEKFVVTFKKGKCPSMYSCFYTENKTNENAIQEAVKYYNEQASLWNIRLDKEPENEWYKEQYEHYIGHTYQVLTYQEFLLELQEYFTKLPIKKIDENRYYYMLECLPPLKWERDSFFMSEMEIDTWTLQLLKIGDNYYEAFSNIKNPKTYIQTRFKNGETAI